MSDQGIMMCRQSWTHLEFSSIVITETFMAICRVSMVARMIQCLSSKSARTACETWMANSLPLRTETGHSGVLTAMYQTDLRPIRNTLQPWPIYPASKKLKFLKKYNHKNTKEIKKKSSSNCGENSKWKLWGSSIYPQERSSIHAPMTAYTWTIPFLLQWAVSMPNSHCDSDLIFLLRKRPKTAHACESNEHNQCKDNRVRFWMKLMELQCSAVQQHNPLPGKIRNTFCVRQF